MGTPQTLQLNVKGMSCQHCVKAVTGAVQTLDPQATLDIDLAAGRAVVTTVLDAETVIRSITDEGYEASRSMA